MKKISIIMVFFAVSTVKVYSQLKVDSLGNVGIGGQTEASSKIKVASVLPNGLSIDIDRRNADNSTNNVGLNVLLRPNSSFAFGVNSIVTHLDNAFTSDYSAGCIGEAYGSTQSNYGLAGLISPAEHGAAIYGTPFFSYLSPNRSLAALFWGPTCIEGDLTVSGSVNGIILGASTSSNSLNHPDVNRLTNSIVSERLKGLSASSFYITDRNAGFTITDAPQNEKSKSINLSPAEREKLEGMKKQTLTKQHYGLSAEELEEVFPDLVYENEDGTKSINYVEMVPILVQAINELNAKIEVLEGGDGGVKKVKSQATNSDEMAENITVLSLGQNKPNPFGTSTSIEVSIPEDVQSAFIYVYDLTGKKLQQMDVVARGRQTISLNASSLTDGMYLYSLIADGKVVETRRMIVEK